MATLPRFHTGFFVREGGGEHFGDLLKHSYIGGESGMPNRNHDLCDTKVSANNSNSNYVNVELLRI